MTLMVPMTLLCCVYTARASLFPKVYYSIRLEASEHILQKLPVADIAYLKVNVLA